MINKNNEKKIFILLFCDVVFYKSISIGVVRYFKVYFILISFINVYVIIRNEIECKICVCLVNRNELNVVVVIMFLLLVSFLFVW